MNLIGVSFYLEDKGEDALLGIYAYSYPSYRAGDVIWLEIQQTPVGLEKHPEKEASRGKYEIVSVHHTVTRMYGNNTLDMLGLEVVLRPLEAVQHG